MVKKNNKIVCVVGPTASGKTAFSIELAKRLDGEIVSCDSMQIYRGMDIGTAKPTPDEMQGVVHHMLSVIEPSENYSAARYVEDAGKITDDIIARGKLPIIVGGTGLYVDSLVRGTQFAEFHEDKKLRDKLFSLYEKNGAGYMHKMLSEVDPERASQIHENNVKRVIRALEVYNATGKTITEHDEKTKKAPPKYDACYIGLMFEERERLYERINLRVDKMIEDGLLDEVKKLLDWGISPSSTAMQAIGYKELVEYYNGACTLNEAAENIKQASRHYAKRQMTWFRRNKDINWLAVDKSENVFDLLQASINFISFDSI